MLARVFRSILGFGVRLETMQLIFVVGAIAGMVIEAFIITALQTGISATRLAAVLLGIS